MAARLAAGPCQASTVARASAVPHMCAHERTDHSKRIGRARHHRRVRPPQACAPRKIDGRQGVQAGQRVYSLGRPADCDRRIEQRGQGRRPDAGAAGRDRVGQDLHHGQGNRGIAAARADPRAQQDPCRAALRRVQELLPRERSRIFRQLLRLLPARSLRPAQRHLYREGKQRKRGDRPDAPLGHPRAARTRRRDHRRLGVVPLRYRLGRNLFGDDLRHQEGRSGRPARADPQARRAAVQAQ